jgi:hypothetical protein
MATTPSMPPFFNAQADGSFQSMSQPTTPMNPAHFDPSGPTARWQSPRGPWPPQPTSHENPHEAGILSPLSQFNPGWHQPSPSNRPWASPSQTSTSIPSQSTSTAVPPQWNGTPYYPPGAHNPVYPALTGSTQSATPHPWNWAREWDRGGGVRSSASSVTSSPDSRDSPGDRALTPFQSLNRHDSVTTISSGYSKSAATTLSGPQHELALATGRPPQQWRADFKMPRTGIAALMHRKKRSIAYPGQ